MSWNYRLCTRIENKEGAVPWRSYSIKEVYYDENKIPNGYTEREPLQAWDEMEDLKGTYDMIAAAFTKPIIDLDNFPNEFTPEDTKKS